MIPSLANKSFAFSLASQPPTRGSVALRLRDIAPSLRDIALCIALACVGFYQLPCSQAHAGLTGCDLVLVVNGDSADSRTIANYFIALRDIPPSNVIVLEDIPPVNKIGVDAFRSKILRPILAEIDRRKLAQHIQGVVYSADFPTAIDITADLKDIKQLARVYTRVGSLNGLTCLYSRVNQSLPGYIDLKSNFYARRKLDDLFVNPAGELTREAWSDIQKSIAAGKHGQASQALLKLFAEHPKQHPLAYLAAAEAALEGETQQAIKILEKAVAAGWDAGGFLAKDKRFDSLRDDPAFQVMEFSLDSEQVEFQRPVGFDARTLWAPNGIPVQDEKHGARFLLSAVLAVTNAAGTSVEQAIEYLTRAASADATHPAGSFYFCLTQDVRSQTRKWGFLSATDDLKAMGFDAEIVQQTLPKNAPAVLGVQSGAASYSWPASGSRFVPGAIADNLTSFGGVMDPGSSQTKLTEFLKAGAAGSSGTVTEPYAIQEKFPLPRMYVHYAAGATLAEAFYLNVSGPYQLLIVGDPLCRPFSNAPRQPIDNALRKLEPEELLNLDLDLEGPSYLDWLDDSRPPAQKTEPLAPASFKVLLDGTNPQLSAAAANVRFSLKEQPAGYHEVTLRFAADDPLRQSSQLTLPIWIGDEDQIQMDIDSSAKPVTQFSRSLTPISNGQGKLDISISAPSSVRISLWNNWEQVAMATGPQASLSLDLGSLGTGPVRLQAKAETEDGQIVQSLPHWLLISD